MVVAKSYKVFTYIIFGMYKKEMLGNTSKEHLFSPPLSFALPRSVGGFFCGEGNNCLISGFFWRSPLK